MSCTSAIFATCNCLAPGPWPASGGYLTHRWLFGDRPPTSFADKLAQIQSLRGAQELPDWPPSDYWKYTQLSGWYEGTWTEGALPLCIAFLKDWEAIYLGMIAFDSRFRNYSGYNYYAHKYSDYGASAPTYMDPPYAVNLDYLLSEWYVDTTICSSSVLPGTVTDFELEEQGYVVLTNSPTPPV
jgi:hypothetical protein